MPDESTAETSDEELVRLAQNGDTRAFDELVIKYSRKLYGMVYHMTSNKDDTHDLLQDIFAKALPLAEAISWEIVPSTPGFYTIAHNMTVNFLKKRKRRATWSLDDVDSGIEKRQRHGRYPPRGPIHGTKRG